MAIDTPEGQLQGTLEQAEGPLAALILPGSGPTDRDGNNAVGLRSDSYRLLAEALQAAGITTLRIDKRGIGTSDGDANDVSLDLYRQDTAGWATALRTATGAECVWLIGHSEGGLLALHAADLPGICGLVLLTAPGRPLGPVLIEQLRLQPQFADQVAPMERALTQIADGIPPDTTDLHPELVTLLTGPASGYFTELIRTDPAGLAAATDLPVLVLDGDLDLQVPVTEADFLIAANPSFARATLASMTHMLKQAADPGMEANLATYTDPTLPLHPELVPTILGFLTAP